MNDSNLVAVMYNLWHNLLYESGLRI